VPRRAMLVLTTALLALGLSPAIRAKEPARGRGAGASRVTRAHSVADEGSGFQSGKFLGARCV
jgi:hypothetical protein